MTVQQMLDRGRLNSAKQLDYAFGLVISKYKRLPTVDHSGADAGYRSDLDPSRSFASFYSAGSGVQSSYLLHFVMQGKRPVRNGSVTELAQFRFAAG